MWNLKCVSDQVIRISLVFVLFQVLLLSNLPKGTAWAPCCENQIFLRQNVELTVNSFPSSANEKLITEMRFDRLTSVLLSP